MSNCPSPDEIYFVWFRRAIVALGVICRRLNAFYDFLIYRQIRGKKRVEFTRLTLPKYYVSIVYRNRTYIYYLSVTGTDAILAKYADEDSATILLYNGPARASNRPLLISRRVFPWWRRLLNATNLSSVRSSRGVVRLCTVRARARDFRNTKTRPVFLGVGFDRLVRFVNKRARYRLKMARARPTRYDDSSNATGVGVRHGRGRIALIWFGIPNRPTACFRYAPFLPAKSYVRRPVSLF